jgi:transposase
MRPRDRRRILNGILWLHATGVPWRDLPDRYGPWHTVASQFYRWVHAGVWDQILGPCSSAATLPVSSTGRRTLSTAASSARTSMRQAPATPKGRALSKHWA